MDTLTKPEIEALNQEAEHVARDTENPSELLEACQWVAERSGLSFVAQDGSCAVYQSDAGRLVNLWVEGIQGAYIGDGGFGFDDQVEWYTEREATNA